MNKHIELKSDLTKEQIVSVIRDSLKSEMSGILKEDSFVIQANYIWIWPHQMGPVIEGTIIEKDDYSLIQLKFRLNKWDIGFSKFMYLVSGLFLFLFLVSSKSFTEFLMGVLGVALMCGIVYLVLLIQFNLNLDKTERNIIMKIGAQVVTNTNANN